MIIKYSILRASTNGFSKDTLESVLEIDMTNQFAQSLTKGILVFSVEYTDTENLDTITDQILKYAEFRRTYYILSAKKDRFVTHFGFTKISGTTLFLVDKEQYDRDIKNYSEESNFLYAQITKTALHSHIGFISDDLKLFYIKENYSNYQNNSVRATKPIKINNPIKFKL